MTRPATSRLKVNPPVGMRPSLEFRRVHELKIDPSYQRTIDTGPSQTLIRRIAVHWDWGLCQPLIVAKRADGSLFVVDGQHRLAAARMRSDIYDLPCVVTAYDNAGDEAAAFVALNQQRRPLTKANLFQAALAAEDEEAMEIARLIRAAGLSITAAADYKKWKPGQVNIIGPVERVYRRHGAKVTGRALKCLAKGFEGQVLRYAGTIFGGIANLISLDDEVDQDLLALVLQGVEQKTWVSEIGLEAVASSARRETAATTVISKAYREALSEFQQDQAA